MKYILFFFQFMLLLSLPTYSQEIDVTKAIRGGDLLSKKCVAYESITKNHFNEFSIDLRAIEVLQKQYNVLYKNICNDTVVCYENDTRTYYRQVDNELLISGYEDHFSKITYDMPEIWLRYSMQIGDSICGYFHGFGDYCRQLYMRTMGTYKTIVEGYGNVILE